MGLAGFDRSSLRLLKTRNFGIFAVGLGTSILGAEMAGVALVFAILDQRGSLSDVSLVLTARILPMTLFLLGGGVIGDRYPRRYVLAVADSLRLLSQIALALYFLAGASRLWVILVLCGLVGVSEALFEPAYEGLIPELAPQDRLHDANALLNLMRSSATVAGPATAGALVAVTSPVVTLLACAAGYAVNVGAVLLLRIRGAHLAAARTSFISELRQGWTIFRSHSWLWTIAIQFAAFNLVVWAPFLVLGPAAAKNGYGGSGAWGAIIATYGLGAIVGGVAMLGRRPRRPLIVATIVTIGWAAPSAALALDLPLTAVIAGALIAGIANTTFGTIFSTAVQQRIPADSLSRVRSYVMLGAFSMGPLGLAIAGPVAEATSIYTVLAVGVMWQLLANSLLLCMPVIRRFRPLESPAAGAGEAVPATDPSEPATR